MDGDEQIKRTERVLRLDPRHRAAPVLAPLLYKPVETSLKSSGEERWHGVAQVQIRHGCWACAETASGERRCVENVGGDVGEMWRCDVPHRQARWWGASGFYSGRQAYAQAQRREERLLSGEIDSLDAQGCVACSARSVSVSPPRDTDPVCATPRGVWSEKDLRPDCRSGSLLGPLSGWEGRDVAGWERLPGDVRDSAPGDIGLAPRERGCDALRCPIEGWDMIFGVRRRERKEARGGTCVRAPGLRVRVRSLNERDVRMWSIHWMARMLRKDDARCRLLGDGSRETVVAERLNEGSSREVCTRGRHCRGRVSEVDALQQARSLQRCASSIALRGSAPRYGNTERRGEPEWTRDLTRRRRRSLRADTTLGSSKVAWVSTEKDVTRP
ncbi:hypothetical protein B0H14DRAFT_3764527 [Mycena olivaceomarginata]|nr:hypothetical protein B0H14DRAFT_3764527 [Mycena olivaceomarginata]